MHATAAGSRNLEKKKVISGWEVTDNPALKKKWFLGGKWCRIQQENEQFPARKWCNTSKNKAISSWKAAPFWLEIMWFPYRSGHFSSWEWCVFQPEDVPVPNGNKPGNFGFQRHWSRLLLHSSPAWKRFPVPGLQIVSIWGVRVATPVFTLLAIPASIYRSHSCCEW